MTTKYPTEIPAALDVWKTFVASIDWQALIKDVEPKASGWDLIYELPNPLGRAGESFAINEMRAEVVPITEPHFHPEGETEIYIILEGSGKVYVGKEVIQVSAGSIVVIPSKTAHYATPNSRLVMVLINTPPFKAKNYLTFDTSKSRNEVDFDAERFKQLTAQLT